MTINSYNTQLVLSICCDMSLFFHVQNSYINMVFRSTWKKILNIKHNNEIPHYSIGTSSTVNLCYNKITKFSLYSHCLPGSLFFQKLSPIPWFYLLILHLAPYTHSAHPTVLWFSTSTFSFMHNIHHLLPDYIIYIFT